MNNPNYNRSELSQVSRYVKGHCRTLVDEREMPGAAPTSLGNSVDLKQGLKTKFKGEMTNGQTTSNNCQYYENN